ncbi:MAG: proline dehydrogenase family protein [Holophaga sp.]|nr:proline dehydrogenase family protein [Holophaga sp.]
MIRNLLATLSRHPWVRKTAMSTPVLRDVAWRLVAGESQEDGLAVVRTLNAKGIKGTMNFIGTHVRSEPEAVRAADTAIEGLRRVQAEGLDSHLSLKLTQIGLDVDPAFCRLQLDRVLAAAQHLGSFVRIDMEESAYTGETLRIFEEARAGRPDSVGIVLQSYLRRNQADLERMVALGARIRLVKGGYWESAPVALRNKEELDRAFLRDLEFLILHGHRPALATHDPAAVARAVQVLAAAGLPKDAMEFQMLYGVRQDLAEALVRDGYTVRSYVPYGAHWYEYVLGCIRRDPGRLVRTVGPQAR